MKDLGNLKPINKNLPVQFCLKDSLEGLCMQTVMMGQCIGVCSNYCCLMAFVWPFPLHSKCLYKAVGHYANHSYTELLGMCGK